MSHFRGIQEREIRAVSKVRTGMLTEQNLKLADENFSALLCEVGSVLNGRLLCEEPNE